MSLRDMTDGELALEGQRLPHTTIDLRDMTDGELALEGQRLLRTTIDIKNLTGVSQTSRLVIKGAISNAHDAWKKEVKWRQTLKNRANEIF